jgi:hypothetical protein
VLVAPAAGDDDDERRDRWRRGGDARRRAEAIGEGEGRLDPRLAVLREDGLHTTGLDWVTPFEDDTAATAR